jgi:hypothetical protein
LREELHGNNVDEDEVKRERGFKERGIGGICMFLSGRFTVLTSRPGIRLIGFVAVGREAKFDPSLPNPIWRSRETSAVTINSRNSLNSLHGLHALLKIRLVRYSLGPRRWVWVLLVWMDMKHGRKDD